MRPRRPGADHSVGSGIAAEYSPATKTPPRKRRTRTSTMVPAPSTRRVGMHPMSSAQLAVPPMAGLVVRVRPSRSETGPRTRPPTGRPSSMAMTMTAPVPVAAAGPASRAITGASAVSGRKTWTLSIRLPTTPARSAARPAGGRATGGSDGGRAGELIGHPFASTSFRQYELDQVPRVRSQRPARAHPAS